MPKINDTIEPKMNKKQQREQKRKPKKAEREVVHEKVIVQLCQGDDALTVERAKELLGWEEETEETKFGSDYQMVDYHGTKIRTKNNTKNRPWEKSVAMAYAQNVLRKRWKLNGETIVIDTIGEVNSGQHRFSGLIIAEQARIAEPAKWEEEWPEAVTMPAIIVFGVEGDDDTVNTQDTGRPRSVADILYRSVHFAHHPANDRKKVCRVAEYAIRLVWARTGAKKDPYAPISTKAECVAFLDNHKTLAKCIEHVFTEDKEGAISKYVSPGTAAGLCYLMAASKANGEKYRTDAKTNGLRQEKGLDLSLFDKASDFWMLIGQQGTDDLKSLRHAIKMIADPDSGQGGATVAEKIALVIKAWLVFVEGRKVVSQDLKLQYKVQDEENAPRVLTGTYEVSGIDFGDADEEEEADEVEMTEEEVETSKAKERDAKVKEMAKKLKDDKRKKMAGASAPSATDSAKAYRDNYGKLCEANPDRIIFVQARDSGNYSTIDGDAITCAKELGLEVETRKDGLKFLTITKKDANETFDKLVKADIKIAVAVEQAKGMKQKETKVTDWTIE